MKKMYIIYSLFWAVFICQLDAKEQAYYFRIKDDGRWCVNSIPKICLSKEYHITSVENSSISFETTSEQTKKAYYKGSASFSKKNTKPPKESCFEIGKDLKILEKRKFLGFQTLYFNLKGKQNQDFGIYMIDIRVGCLLLIPKYEPSWEYLSKIIQID